MRNDVTAYVLWDASGLAKRYVSETGSHTVNALFASNVRMMAVSLGYAETYSILLRRLNDGRLNAPTFTTATLALEREVLDAPDFDLLSIDDAAIIHSISLMRRHNLNASDAVIFALFLRYAQARLPSDPPCLLVAADQRLLRAASSEGLATLNPELVAPADVSALLSTL